MGWFPVAFPIYPISRLLRQVWLTAGLFLTMPPLQGVTYSSQFWWGFTNATDKIRLESFLKKAAKCNFYSGVSKFEDLAEKADNRLFQSIIKNPRHPIYQLLPPAKQDITQRLRPRPHNFELPSKINSLVQKNFLFRMLYKNSY